MCLQLTSLVLAGVVDFSHTKEPQKQLHFKAMKVTYSIILDMWKKNSNFVD